jgi:hypothetical protein
LAKTKKNGCLDEKVGAAIAEQPGFGFFTLANPFFQIPRGPSAASLPGTGSEHYYQLRAFSDWPFTWPPGVSHGRGSWSERIWIGVDSDGSGQQSGRLVAAKAGSAKVAVRSIIPSSMVTFFMFLPPFFSGGLAEIAGPHCTVVLLILQIACHSGRRELQKFYLTEITTNHLRPWL